MKGMRQLQNRLTAVRRTADDREMLEKLGLTAVREQKLLVPRRTGNLGRSIRIAQVNRYSVITEAGADYAAAVEFGTRQHTIRPRRAKALRWKQGGKVIFARSVRHPGTRPRPFMLPGALRALERFGLRDFVVARWNKAA